MVLFSYSAHWLPTRTTTLLRANPARGLLIREKKEIEKVYQCPPPPPRCSFGGNNQKITPRIYMRLGATQVSFRLAPAQRFLRLVDWANWCRFGRFYASVCDDNFTSLSASLFFWRCLAARLSLFPSRGHEPPPALRDSFNSHLSL